MWCRWSFHWRSSFLNKDLRRWGVSTQLSREKSVPIHEIPWHFSGENRQAVGNRGEDWLAGENRARTVIMEFVADKTDGVLKPNGTAKGKKDRTCVLKGWVWTGEWENNSASFANNLKICKQPMQLNKKSNSQPNKKRAGKSK